MRTFLEASYDRYINVVALLAVAEEEVILLAHHYDKQPSL